MKKTLFILLGMSIVFSGCGSYTASGAYTGSMLGSILGSAIGGINDGPRGSDIGTIIGMAGGAAVGAAIGSAADKAQADQYQQYQQDRQQDQQSYQQRNSSRQYDNQQYNNQQSNSNNSGFDPTNSGDDRIYEYNDDAYNGQYSASKPQNVTPSEIATEGNNNLGFKINPTVEIRNARFVDNNRDGLLSAGEECKIIFEVRNNSAEILYDVQPLVTETSGNRHIYVSPGIHVESIAAGKGIRYTAMVKADNRLKDGTATFRIAVAQGNNKIVSQVKEFNITTSRQ